MSDIRICTWNVHNLFCEGDGDWFKPRREVKSLAATIDRLTVDVLALQEVGSMNALEALNMTLQRPFEWVDMIPGNSDRNIHLGMLSRFPMQLLTHRDQILQDETGAALLEHPDEQGAADGVLEPMFFQRDLLLTEVAIPGHGPTAIFNVHLKSKTNRPWRSQPADVVRRAECVRIAEIVGSYLEAHPATPVFLVGDFNDTRHGDALAPIFDLPLLDPMGLELARSGQNPSTYWPRRRMRIDFVLAGTVAGKLLTGQNIHRTQQARRGSDHYPVTVDLDYTRLQSARLE